MNYRKLSQFTYDVPKDGNGSGTPPPGGPPSATPPGTPQVPGSGGGDPPAFPKLNAPTETPGTPGAGDAPPVNQFHGPLADGTDYTAPTMADGFELDTAMFDGFKPIAKELGLNQAGLQKAADFIMTHQKAQQDAWLATVNKWGEDAKADKEFGGEKFSASVANANKGLSVFGTPALTNMLREYGLGNHPEVIRVFSRIGAAIASEDKTPPGQQVQTPSAKNTLDLFYGPKT